MATDSIGKKLIPKSQNVRVFCRLRPEKDELEKIQFDGEETVILGDTRPGREKNKKIYTFDGILPPKTTQQEAFNKIALPTCHDLLHGFNSTLFVYGQSGSGKTFTMYGREVEDPQLKRVTLDDDPKTMGIVPMIVHHLITTLEDEKNEEFCDIRGKKLEASFLEIYIHDTLHDLIDPSHKIVLGSSKSGYCVAQNLTSTEVEDAGAMLKLINKATGNRARHPTLLNATSSRSHLILRLKITITHKDGKQVQAVGNFVDLAGSERVGKTGATGAVLEEAKHINKSLSSLSLVISKLASGKGGHIPFRDTALTRILQESLSGNCKTTLIVAARPAMTHRQETISTLNFGKNCKSIKLKVSPNFNMTKEQLRKEIAKLQEALEEAQNAKVEQASELVKKENETLKQELDDKNKELETLGQEKEAIENELQQRNSEFEELKTKIEELEGMIEELKEAKRILEDKLANKEINYDELHKENEELKARLKEKNQENEQLTIENDGNATKIDDLEQQIKEFETIRVENEKLASNKENEAKEAVQNIELQLQNNQKKLKEKQEQNLKLAKENKDWEFKCNDLQTEKKEYEKEISRLKEEKSKIEFQRLKSEKTYEQLEKEHNELKEEMNCQSDEFEKFKHEYELKESECQDLQGKYQEALDQLASLEEKQQSMIESQEHSKNKSMALENQLKHLRQVYDDSKQIESDQLLAFKLQHEMNMEAVEEEQKQREQEKADKEQRKKAKKEKKLQKLAQQKKIIQEKQEALKAKQKAKEDKIKEIENQQKALEEKNK